MGLEDDTLHEGEEPSGMPQVGVVCWTEIDGPHRISLLIRHL